GGIRKLNQNPSLVKGLRLFDSLGHDGVIF
ncbi:hypothetical protein EVA_11869, partial [gut metagenome]